MGLMDMFIKNPDMIGKVAKLARDNPELANAATRFLSANGGAGGGLSSILGNLQSSGLSDTVSSWLGSGANKSISPSQVKSALGSDTVAQFAKQAGISSDTASSVLANLLPGLVDKLSPDGKLPDSSKLDGMIGSFMSNLTSKR